METPPCEEKFPPLFYVYSFLVGAQWRLVSESTSPLPDSKTILAVSMLFHMTSFTNPVHSFFKEMARLCT